MAEKPKQLIKRPDDLALRRAEAQPSPPMRLAESLEQAAPRTFVHVDRKGQVRSPQRYKLLQAASYGAAAAIVGGVTVVYGALLGVPGVGIGAAFAAYFGWHLKRGRMLHKATVLLVHDQLDEAEALLGALPPDIAKDAHVERGRATIALARSATPGVDTAPLEARVAANPEDYDALFDLSAARMANGNRDGAADALLAIIAGDRGWQDGKARNQLLQLFEVVGLEDPWVSAQRRRLSAILFS